MLKRPLTPWSPTAHAAHKFLKHKGIYTIMEIDSVQNWQILSTSNPGWQHVLRSYIVLITGIAWGQEDRWANKLAKRLIVNGIEC